MKPDNEKISDYLNHLAVEKALAQNTLDSYRRDLLGFQTFLNSNGLALAATTMELMSEYVAWLRGKNSGTAPLAESSISRAVVSVRNFYKFNSKEYATVDPIHDFHPPKIPKRLPKALTVGEITSLINHAFREADVVSLRDVALIELIYATGARISEVVNLSISDIAQLKEDGSQAVKLRGKGSKERVVPVGRYAREAVTDYLVRVRPMLESSRKTDAVKSPKCLGNNHFSSFPRQDRKRCDSAFFAAFLCDAFVRWWCRYSGGSGIIRTFLCHNNSDLHHDYNR
jgi:integrase/recombinase XerD